jgi:organic radical activating enzyme/uncharacterized protein YqfB (UPF0267 family)
MKLLGLGLFRSVAKRFWPLLILPDMSDSCIVSFKPTNPRFTQSLQLRWIFADKPIAKRYFKALQIASSVKPVYQPNRFYNFPQAQYTEEVVVNGINRAIDVINSYHKNLIQDSAKVGMSQEDMNTLHRNFERHRGPLLKPAQAYIESPRPVQEAFDDLNMLIHRYEDMDFTSSYHGRSEIASARLCFGLDSIVKRYPLEEEDFAEFSFEQEFGGWYLNYCEVGKPLHDIWRDNDLDIVTEAILPLKYYSADAYLHFGAPVGRQGHLRKLEKFYKWWDQNNETLSRLGFKKESKQNSLGQIHLGSLDRDYPSISGLSDKEIVELLSNFQFFETVLTEDRKTMSSLLKFKSFCIYPFIKQSISTSGTIKPCCYFSQNLLGKDKKAITIAKDLESQWNSEDIKRVRKAMLRGEFVAECKKCYEEEITSGTSMRLRGLQSVENEAELATQVRKVGKQDGFSNHLPQALELHPGNLCNLKCRMCNSHSSSKIESELKILLKEDSAPHRLLFVPEYETTEVPPEKSIDWGDPSIWENLKMQASNLRIIDISGGEPLLNPYVHDYIDFLISRGLSSQIELSITTNATLQMDDLIAKSDSFLLLRLIPSIDGFGRMQEYVRSPSKWEPISKNLMTLFNAIPTNPKLRVRVNFTAQLYNVHALPELLEWLEQNCYIDDVQEEEILSPIFLSDPGFLDMRNLPPQSRTYALNSIRSYLNCNSILLQRYSYLKKRMEMIASALSLPYPEHMNYILCFTKVYTEILDNHRLISLREVHPLLHDELKEFHLNKLSQEEQRKFANELQYVKDQYLPVSKETFDVLL